MWMPAAWYRARLAERGVLEKSPNAFTPLTDDERAARDARLDRELATAPDERRWGHAAALSVALALTGERALDSALLPRLGIRTAREVRLAIELEREDRPELDLEALVTVLVELERHALDAPEDERAQTCGALALGWCRAREVERALGWIDHAVKTTTGEAGSEVGDSIGDLPSAWPHAEMVGAARRAGGAHELTALAAGALARLGHVDSDEAPALFGAIVVGNVLAIPSQPDRDQLLERALTAADELADSGAIGTILGVLLASVDRAWGERELGARATVAEPWRMWLNIAFAYVRAGVVTESLAALSRAAEHVPPEKRVQLAWHAAKAGLVAGVLPLLEATPTAANSWLFVATGALNGCGLPAEVDALLHVVLARPELRELDRRRSRQKQHVALLAACAAIAHGLPDPEARWSEALALADGDGDERQLINALERALKARG